MLLCVDQEGGRVQRFRDGYSNLPPLEGFDALYRRDAAAALDLINRLGYQVRTTPPGQGKAQDGGRKPRRDPWTRLPHRGPSAG